MKLIPGTGLCIHVNCNDCFLLVSKVNGQWINNPKSQRGCNDLQNSKNGTIIIFNMPMVYSRHGKRHQKQFCFKPSQSVATLQHDNS